LYSSSSPDIPPTLITESQCCQEAEIPAKKLKRGREKKSLTGRTCGRILPKVAEKGAGKSFEKKFFILHQ
jgi:hypothetical protein